MYVNRHNKVTRQFGFSLWELSIVMLIMIGLFVALVNVMPYIIKRENVEIDKSILVKMDDQLLGFIATYSRLPCPDGNGDGLEDKPSTPGSTCLSNTGNIPYKTLGLNEDYAGVGSIPVKYAVYRNSASSADLVDVTNLFNPTDAHGTTTTINNINGLDFCTAISNGKASTFNMSYAHIVLPDGTTRNAVPYVLVTAGLGNSDGGTTPFDGRNATVALDFESANKEQNASYDDSVYYKSFDELASTLNCDTAQNSLNLLADGKATHEENLAQADNLKANAELAAFILGAQILLGIANTAMAAFTLAAAVTTLATASSLLAGAIASCIVLVGCALIPVYTAGVIASTVAVVAAGVSVAANVAALIAQAVAIGLVIDVAVRAGATISLPEEATDPDDSNSTVDNAELAVQVRAEAEKLKADAAQKVIGARNSVNNTIGIATNIRNQFSTLKTRAQALANTTGVINDATFTGFANATNNQAQTNLTQANTALSDSITARNHADNAVSALGSPVFVFPNITYPNVDYTQVKNHLNLADSKMTTANNSFTNLKNSYTNIHTQATNAKNRIIFLKNNDPYPTPADPLNPTAAEQTAINQWNVRRANYNDAQNKAQNVIDQFNATRRLFFTEVIQRRNDTIEARDDAIEILGDIAPLLPDASQAEIDQRNATIAAINTAIAEQNALINYYNSILSMGGLFLDINRLQDDIQIAFGRIEGAQASTNEAFETIDSAIQAEADAVYFENNVGSGLPNPNGTLLEQAGGVDDILRAADAKGAER